MKDVDKLVIGGVVSFVCIMFLKTGVFVVKEANASKKVYNGINYSKWKAGGVYSTYMGEVKVIDLDTDGMPIISLTEKEERVKPDLKDEYYDSGVLKSRMIFKYDGKNNRKIGIFKDYDENGVLQFEVYYIELDAKYGLVKRYYDSGEVQARLLIKNGKQNGITTKYYENGQVQAEWRYKNGLLDGISKTYYQNGQLETVEEYKDGKEINRKVYNDDPFPPVHEGGLILKV